MFQLEFMKKVCHNGKAHLNYYHYYYYIVESANKLSEGKSRHMVLLNKSGDEEGIATPVVVRTNDKAQWEATRKSQRVSLLKKLSISFSALSKTSWNPTTLLLESALKKTFINFIINV